MSAKCLEGLSSQSYGNIQTIPILMLVYCKQGLESYVCSLVRHFCWQFSGKAKLAHAMQICNCQGQLKQL